MKKVTLLLALLAWSTVAFAEKKSGTDTTGEAAQKSYSGQLSGPRTVTVGQSYLYECTIPGAATYKWAWDDLGGKEYIDLTPNGKKCQVVFLRGTFVELFCYAYNTSGQLLGYQSTDVLMEP